jgi:translation elongation factor EF-Ts
MSSKKSNFYESNIEKPRPVYPKVTKEILEKFYQELVQNLIEMKSLIEEMDTVEKK